MVNLCICYFMDLISILNNNYAGYSFDVFILCLEDNSVCCVFGELLTSGIQLMTYSWSEAE